MYSLVFPDAEILFSIHICCSFNMPFQNANIRKLMTMNAKESSAAHKKE